MALEERSKNALLLAWELRDCPICGNGVGLKKLRFMLDKELLEWIYDISPYNYADLWSFVNEIRPKTERAELVSTINVLDKKIIEIKDDRSIPADLKSLKKEEIMIRLLHQGRQDVQSWRFHDDTTKIGSTGNLVAIVVGVFIIISTVIEIYKCSKRDEKQISASQYTNKQVQSQNKAQDSLRQKNKTFDSSSLKK